MRSHLHADLAERVYEAGRPLLLEVQGWARASSDEPDAHMEVVRTAYHRVVPVPSTATLADLKTDAAPDPTERPVAQPSGHRGASLTTSSG